ncbi:MAG: MATE family efflux transporter [Oscillospiraceae bacterium]
MKIQLSDHFSYGRLLRFTAPSIAMMIFTSVYGVVDGFFVSNYAGKTPFAAVNLILPFLMVIATVGFMFGTGGSALVAKSFGEGEPERANRNFSPSCTCPSPGAVLRCWASSLSGPSPSASARRARCWITASSTRG